MDDMNKKDDMNKNEGISFDDGLFGQQTLDDVADAPAGSGDLSDTKQITISPDDVNIPASELDRMAEPDDYAYPEDDGDAAVRDPKASKRKAIIISAVAFVLIAVLTLVTVAIYNVYFYTKVYKGVFVGGEDFSGASKREVLARLTELYEGKTPGETLEIAIGDQTYYFDISKNVNYDLRTTADNVVFYGRQGSFAKRLGAITEARRFGSEVPMVYTTNDEGLELQIQMIATDIRQDIAQSGWSLVDNKLLLDRGQSGLSLDVKSLLTFIKNRLYNGDLSPSIFELEQDETEALDLAAIKAAIETEKRNPTLDIDTDPTGKTVVPGVPGIYLDLKKANEVLAAADPNQRIIEIPLELDMPDYNDEEYSALLFEDKLSSVETPFTSDADRTTNVVLASEACNGTILLPGETFSYNGVVGERTAAKGYKNAIVYVGNSAENGLGGGVCQISSAIYYCALRADLEIVERYAHSRTVTYVPLGEDATVAWGSKDFKFKNNTDFPIRIVAYHTKSTVTIELWGTNTTPNKEVTIETKVLSRNPFSTVYQNDSSLAPGVEKTKSNGYTGYVTESYRVIKIDGQEVSRTFENKSVYGKHDKVILRNDSAASTVTPVPSETPETPTTPGTSETPTTPSTPETPTTPETPNTPETQEPPTPENPLYPTSPTDLG